MPSKISTAVGLLKYNGKPHEGVEVSLNVRKIDFSKPVKALFMMYCQLI